MKLMNSRRWVCYTAGLLILLTGNFILAQTRIDLRTQVKNVDFSSADFTKPSKTGTTVPVTCTVGETFFRTDAIPGQNLYLCTSTDTWTQIDGSAGGGSGYELLTENEWTSDGRILVTDGATGRNAKETVLSFDGTDLVIPGGISFGTGVTTGMQWMVGNAGDSGASSIVIHGGDGASNSEPGHISAFSSDPTTPFQSFLFPCNEAGRWCSSATEPGADSNNYFVSATETATLQNKTIDNTNLFSGYLDIAEIATPLSPASGYGRLHIDSATGDLACRDTGGGDCMPSPTLYYQTTEDEGSALTQRPAVNFTGDGVSCVDNSGDNRTDCTIDDDIVAIQDEGAPLTQRPEINFTGDGVICTDNSGMNRTDCTIADNSPVIVKTFSCIFDGAGSTITQDSVCYSRIPTSGTITGWSIISAGSSPQITIDVWKVASGDITTNRFRYHRRKHRTLAFDRECREEHISDRLDNKHKR